MRRNVAVAWPFGKLIDHGIFLSNSIANAKAPMTISRAVITQVAHLARLKLNPLELPNYESELSAILDLVAQMNSVDTTDVEPLAHPLEIAARLRPDEVDNHEQRDELQRGAPAIADGYYLVPRVIE